jgi:hypothetical protein
MSFAKRKRRSSPSFRARVSPERRGCRGVTQEMARVAECRLWRVRAVDFAGGEDDEGCPRLGALTCGFNELRKAVRSVAAMTGGPRREPGRALPVAVKCDSVTPDILGAVLAILSACKLFAAANWERKCGKPLPMQWPP